MSRFRCFIAKVLNKHPDTCFAHLLLWTEGIYPFGEIFKPRSAIYNQDCRIDDERSYAFCGKCRTTGNFYSPPGHKRPGPAKRLARALDRLITRAQEWLEGPDTSRAKAIAYGILAAAATYFAVHLFLFLKGVI